MVTLFVDQYQLDIPIYTSIPTIYEPNKVTMQAPQQALKLSLSESFPGPTIDQVRQLAPVPDDQISIWKDPKKVAHVGFHGPGRHATTLELAEGYQFWWPDSHDDSEYDRDVKNIWYSTLRWHLGEILSRDIKRPIVKAGKRPEKELFLEPELQTMLEKMGKTVRRVVVMGLGTLEKAKQEDFPHNYRSYMLVRQIIGSLLEMLREKYIQDWRKVLAAQSRRTESTAIHRLTSMD